MTSDYYKRNKANVQARNKKYYLEHRENMRKWFKGYHKNFRDAMARIKMESGCCDCGYKVHPAALQFDHVRGAKKFHISQCNSIEAAMKEIQKCEIRCANCHQIKTIRERGLDY